MKYFFVTGEASGDMHAAQIIHSLRALDSSAHFFGTGGKNMRNSGVEIVIDIKEMAFMGFIEVVNNFFKIRNNFKKVKEAISSIRPDVIILVDYAGFNLRIAKWAKQQGFKVVFYIAPKVWAWNEKRVNVIKKYIDLLIVIFPFEKEYFENRGIRVVYVGNPLMKKISAQVQNVDKNKIAILPGSRRQEIERMLPIMLESMYFHAQKNLVVAGLSDFGEDFYQSIIKDRAELVIDDTYAVLNVSKLAIVASGTASLEAALMNVPQVVCYKMNRLNYWIARLLLKVNYISLVNLILERPVVPELIQDNMNAVSIKNTAMSVLEDVFLIKDAYLQLRKLLGDGDASNRAALVIHDFLIKGD
ncbi:MAG: lipid-A-disaccharide synthase [Chitinophagales bacterium]|nr:lipid-A-disaccharide synthase [Chitinophagales bacterium]